MLQQKHKRSLSHGENFVGKIRVETRPEERDGTHGVLIAVADNADGIAEEMREAIFEEFFTTKPEGQGAGLGLSIARRLLEQHHGTLDVSDDGELCGARFEIWLPLGGGPVGQTLPD